MNYATQVGKPTAHITKKKSRLKVYNDHVVFLNDKDNFEFEIHNPTNKTVLFKIKLNGSYISTSGVVLKPGQRVFLERFLDSNNKFEFSTYKVQDTSENRSAIDSNGDVLIEFYEEQIQLYQNRTLSSGIHTVNLPHFNSALTTTGTAGYGTTTYTTSNLSNAFYTSSINTGAIMKDIKDRGLYSERKGKKSIETGRVEKGEQSNQTFTNSYEQFNYYTSHTIKFKIQPKSSKNINVDEIRQYCTECGTKMKSNYKFCPSCGNKL
jgi:zinc-ribbon domain